MVRSHVLVWQFIFGCFTPHLFPKKCLVHTWVVDRRWDQKWGGRACPSSPFIALASSPVHAVSVFGADFLWQVQEICPLGVGTSNCVIGDFGCFFIHVAGAVFRSCCWNFGRLRSIWGRLRSIWEVPSEVTLFGRRNTCRTWTMFWNLQKLVSWARRAKLRMPELHVTWQAQHTWKTSMKSCLRARSNIVFKCFWRVQLSFFVAHAIFGAFATFACAILSTLYACRIALVVAHCCSALYECWIALLWSWWSAPRGPLKIMKVSCW